jgi:hypothetical protein
MRNITQHDLESTRPDSPLEETLSYCLKQFYADCAHEVTEEFIHGLSFEEVIGTLLQARDLLEECQQREREEEKLHYTAHG